MFPGAYIFPEPGKWRGGAEIALKARKGGQTSAVAQRAGTQTDPPPGEVSVFGIRFVSHFRVEVRPASLFGFCSTGL